jgi:NAD(P)-dependent dehydrogenase (short-subunit alcohol dehydrogenase family)
VSTTGGTGRAPTRRPVAIVTGGGGAIGHAIGLALASTGFDICAVDLASSALTEAVAAMQAIGGTCRAYACDVADPDQVDATVSQIVAHSGQIDVLVNNAGIVHVDDLLDLSFATWRRIMAVNADGTFLMSQAATRTMVNQAIDPRLQRRGMLINISSAAAEVGRPTRAAYAASKAVVKHLTLSQSLALKEHAVAACVVYPGEVIEGMLRSIFVDIAHAQGRGVDKVIGEAEAEQPTGRFQPAAEVGQRVAFLASSPGMRHTGTVLWCDSHVDPVPPS